MGGGGILGGDLSALNSSAHKLLESMESIELPDSHEVWLVRDLLGHLVWELEGVLSDDLWGELVKGLPFFLELNSSLLGGSVNTKDNLLILVGMGEGVEDLLLVVQMSIVSEPGWVWDLVVEKSGGSSFTELLKSKPLNNIWLLSLSEELHWGPLSGQVSHGVLPSLSGVSINLPSISLVCGSPVWDSETLE